MIGYFYSREPGRGGALQAFRRPIDIGAESPAAMGRSVSLRHVRYLARGFSARHEVGFHRLRQRRLANEVFVQIQQIRVPGLFGAR